MEKDYIEDIVRTAFLQIENEMAKIKSNKELTYFNEAIETEVRNTNAYISQIAHELDMEASNYPYYT